MEDGKMSEDILTSAAAFVEGGIQDACDDACSICLEAFCDSDPSTVTGCKHEFHLQCILEWCQRSSQCPMCWQVLSLKDPNSQELLVAVEHERNIRMNPPRNTTIFHHPTLGDFELQHLPVSATDSELEERIIQHLAAAAAMGRTRHLARREGQQGRSSGQGHPHFLVFSTHPNAPPPAAAAASSSTQRSGGVPAPAFLVSGQDSPIVAVGEGSGQLVTQPSSFQADQVSASGSGSNAAVNQLGTSSNDRRTLFQSSPNHQHRARPSDFQSFSESIKSRLSAMSMRYKESLTKSSRGWKEKFFSRNSSTSDHGLESRNDISAAVATVSHLMEHLETTDSRASSAESNILEETLPAGRAEQHIPEIDDTHSLNENNRQAPCAASSGSN
ncbi:PREDICTED: E3 ubiquitin-protein ligase RHF2A-like [Nicotiana attenuata]|uniref:RING-type E3 ubiquitin transferase n=1 Tax=Nicotiana attenuata TaxID=49451 RepID=A0A314KZR3_NICAT|nr:PREDICTED: E3 ubiquitin-protein ligase RHF2A-like [Nicotiana attenuata]OIT34234.1 e3 ubiquitin-protein ligase rhf2a [Nicotiana attenuata]